MNSLNKKLWNSIFFLIIPFLAISQVIENSYEVNQQVSVGGSSLFYVQISGAPAEAIITKVEVKIEYIAYGVVQNYVSCRFHKGSDPGADSGILLIPQGSLPSGNPGTWGFKSYSDWNNQKEINTKYFFRFYLSGLSPYTCTIKRIFVKISYSHQTPPVLLSPVNGGTLTGPPFHFTWQAVNGAGAYQLKISDHSSFQNPLLNDLNISGSESSYQANINLNQGQTYYWQMRTLNNSGTQWGPWGHYQTFSVSGTTSNLPVDDYPAAYKNSGKCCEDLCVADVWAFFRRECTSFVSWRINRDLGYTRLKSTDPFQNHSVFGHNTHLGNAKYWAGILQSLNFNVDDIPKVGDIAHWDYGDYGHVAYVQSVNSDNTVNIEEYNFNSTCSTMGLYSYRKNVKAQKYIHIRDGRGGTTNLNSNGYELHKTNIYPNPTSSFINIDFNTPEDRVMHIFNCNGQLLFTKELSGTTNKIELSFLESGIYYIKIINDSKTYKIVKYE